MKNKGFTLIELLVVIFVIGLVATLTTFAMGGFGQDKKLEHTMKLLVNRLRLAHMEAVFEQEHVGVAIDDQGYRFYRRDNERSPWKVITDESALLSDLLPKHKALQVRVLGQSLQLSQNTPQVIITQHEIRPFEIQVVDLDQTEFLIKSNDQGDIVWAVN